MVRRWPAGGVLCSLVLTVIVSGSCDDGLLTPSPPGPVSPALTRFEVQEVRLFAIGDTLQMRATAGWSDGTSADVTTDVSWVAPSNTVVSVSSGGLVQALDFGMIVVRAIYRTARLDVKVSVTPEGTYVVAGRTRQPGSNPGAGSLDGVTIIEPVSGQSTVTNTNGTFMLARLIGRELRLTKDSYEPATAAVVPFSDDLNIPLQPVMQTIAGGSVGGLIAPNDLEYTLPSGNSCGLCRLVRIQSSAAGTLRLTLRWSESRTRLILWAGGQEFGSRTGAATEITAAVAIEAGETIVFVGASGTDFHTDFQLTTTFERETVLYVGAATIFRDVDYRLTTALAPGGG